LKREITQLITFVSVLSLVSGAAYAQLTSLPVSFSPKEEPKLTTLVIHGDFGFFNRKIGNFKSFAGRAFWNPGRFSIMGGAGALFATNDLGDNGFTVGASLGYDLKPGSPLPQRPIIQIKGGIGYAKINDSKQWNIPLALGFASILPPPKINITLWGAPRLHLRILDEHDTASNPEKAKIGLGVSAGIAITSYGGPGVHLDFEWLRISSHNEFIIAAGLHWNFALLSQSP